MTSQTSKVKVTSQVSKMMVTSQVSKVKKSHVSKLKVKNEEFSKVNVASQVSRVKESYVSCHELVCLPEALWTLIFPISCVLEKY